MAEWTVDSWPKCQHEEGCIGVQLAVSKMCLAHASPEKQEAALEVIKETGKVDGRGVPFTTALLERVLAAVPHTDNGQAMLKASLFDGATFTGDARFDGATFTGDARFDGATFTGDARFDGATFSGEARFDGATFSGVARFSRTTFTGDAGFGGATFTGSIGFDGATFTGRAGFGGATITGDAAFGDATFNDHAEFLGATFSGIAWFQGATFSGDAAFGYATFSRLALFDWATFTGDAGFREATFPLAKFTGVTFRGNADFDGATFNDHAEFLGATFTGIAGFRGATFTGPAVFDGATFTGFAGFTAATFTGTVGLWEATFSGYADFDRATFTSDALFDAATFTTDARFGAATFTGDAVFDRATFTSDALFGGATFRRLAKFSRTRFEQAREFGPMLAHRLVLDDAQFAQQVQIKVNAIGLCCRRARFPAGVQFQLRWARVVLDDADFPAPSLLTGMPNLADAELAAQEKQIAQEWLRAGETSARPQLLSLHRANVAGLGLSNITLADCRFAGAHNLDKMRLEADVSFAPTPSSLARLSWERRQVIAEERTWRASRHHRSGWSAPCWPDWLGDRPGPLDPGQIAGLYRALRKGREDIKDEPGAGDLYYGEMEMRRHSPTTPKAERAIIWLYWLISGYGLRALRSLAALVIFGVIVTAGLTGWGVTAADLVTAPPQHLAGTVTTTPHQRVQISATLNGISPQQPPASAAWTIARTQTALEVALESFAFRSTDQPLTTTGVRITTAARILGPVLLALALLAIRNRVKR
jgi:hypothetical protein